jgi:hypothetical protein
MNRISRLPAFLLVTALFLFSGCPMGDGGMQAEGKVLDQAGTPISGAKVVLISKGEKDEMESRDDGSYSLGVMHAPVTPEGTLTASKAGYSTYQLTFSSRGDIGRPHDIVLKPLAISDIKPR